jgi:hypothetical protein
LFQSDREQENKTMVEVKQKEKEKQDIFDALPEWKKRLLLEKKS